MNRISLFAFPALLITPIASVAAAEFVEFGSDLSLLVNAISADGNVVVGETRDEPTLTDDRAFVWTRETGVQILDLPEALDVSADGSIVLGNKDGQPFLWTEETGLTGLGRLADLGCCRVGSSISDDGATVVVTGGAGPPPPDYELRGFRWTDESGFVSLVPPGTSRSHIRSISANGAVIALQAEGTNGNWDGFTWTEENGFQSMGDRPPGWDAVAPDVISADGSVIFGTDNGSGGLVGRPFRWTAEDGIEPLPLLPGTTYAQVEDLSPDGSIMVGFGLRAGPAPQRQRTAFVWDEQHGTRNLRDVLLSDHGFSEQDLPPELTLARGLSADAMTIVGTNGEFNSSVDIGKAWAIYLDKPLVSFGLDGDYNNNGTVEQADLDLVLLHWGADASAVPDTWTNDLPTGTIDQNELDGVLLNWGSTSAPIGATSVPEPSTAIIATIAMAALLIASTGHHASLLRGAMFTNQNG